MTAKIGRPKSENPKDIRFSVRMSANEYQTLEEFCTKNEITKTEAVRKGLQLLMRRN